MLVKCVLTQYVTKVDTAEEDMIWVKLSLCSGVSLGGVYIPPEDSPHYDPSLFGAINARCVKDSVIVLGDFNARVGVPIITDGDGNDYVYNDVKDAAVNSHGGVLLSICENTKI